MVLSILIVNWNTRDFLLKCLESIIQFPPKEGYEIIVVDNDSSDESAQAVESKFPSVILLRPGKNLGYAAGNNLAFAKAKGNYLLTLNPDTRFQDDTLQRAVKYMNDHPSIGSIGIKQIGTDGLIQKSVRGFPTLWGLVGEYLGFAKLFPNSFFGSYRLNAFDYNLEQKAPQPMGTFLLFRRQALDSCGDSKNPFDTSFPLFFNEVDLLKRLQKAKWECWYVPSLSILHYGGASTKQIRKSAIWESHRSLLRYWHKHSKNGLERFGIKLLTPVLLTLAFIRAKGYSSGFRN